VPTKARIFITLDESVLKRVDRLVANGRYSSRSDAVRDAVRAQVDRFDRARLGSDLLKLDRSVEQRMAEEGAAFDLESWPG
jgi:Arc/MetJ-type ribon-helix-helix transcriptional regulator